jgi:hypothetical protein
MENISIKDIQRIEDNRKKLKKEIYIKIYDQFSRKIKNAVQMNQIHVCLRVPAFLIGYPTYDLLQAARYLERQLNNSGFTVSYISEIDFYVSWNPNGRRRRRVVTTSRTRATGRDTENHSGDGDDDDAMSLPSLMNLKKAANKLRK